MTLKKRTSQPTMNFYNRRARYDYELQDRYVAGIVLLGSEIKSLRQGSSSLQEAYCYFHHDELWVKQLHIPPYQAGAHHTHEPLRLRKLLLHRRELKKLQRQSMVKGRTIVPLRLFLNPKGLAKLEIAVAIGKKQYDKRATIKEREIARNLAKDHHRER